MACAKDLVTGAEDSLPGTSAGAPALIPILEVTSVGLHPCAFAFSFSTKAVGQSSPEWIILRKNMT
jgi:hypothetical protein